jgi:hypothetical protein
MRLAILAFCSWVPLALASFCSPAEVLTGEEEPYKRVLKGGDATRVTELESRIKELTRAGKFAVAQEPAQDVLKIRTNVQGADHWETALARWSFQSLTKLAAMPEAAQKEFARSLQLDDQGDELEAKRRFPAAEPLFRKALAIRQETLGKDWEEYIETKISYNNMGFNLANQDKHRDAEPYNRKALPATTMVPAAVAGAGTPTVDG